VTLVSRSDTFDAAVVGAGFMGVFTALNLAEAGHRVLLLDRRGLCQEASGANAGSLCLQIKPMALLPHALEAWCLWRSSSAWLGRSGGFTTTGSLLVAFNEEEQSMLETRIRERASAGAPLELIGGTRARQLEPALGPHVRAASFCAVDGFADPNALARTCAAALKDAGVAFRGHIEIIGAVREENGFALLGADRTRIAQARRLVLAGGAWTGLMAEWLGVSLPFFCRPYQMIATERLRPVLGRFVGLASAKLSLKQTAGGSVLIGGGWPAIGGPQSTENEVIMENVIGNVRLAHHAVPALVGARVVRAWVGLEAELPDALPALGRLPGVPDAYVLAATRSGFTMAPVMAALLADLMEGRSEGLAAFDPCRFIGRA